jgi:outer membrane protein OmpA-like peptidoglycan-associated protein
MKKRSLILLFLVFCLLSQAQITILGHSVLNNSPIMHTAIQVKVNGVTTKTLNTLGRPDFKIELPFGQIYQIYFLNKVGPMMHMEVIGNTVPADKYRYLMTYELNVPFVNRLDEDVDTSVFQSAFHRILYNGVNQMVPDTAYNLRFENSVIKKNLLNNKQVIQKDPTSKIILTGKISCGNGNACLTEKQIQLYGKNGQVLKSTVTNRLGSFAFTGVPASEVDYIMMDFPEMAVPAEVMIVDNKDKLICQSTISDKHCKWQLTSQNLDKMLDDNFATNIGGKLISSSPREKKFYAEKTVYLSNKMHTVLKKTKTNLFGTFVFENIRPDNTYYIGIDPAECTAGAKVDLLNKEDRYVTTLDTVVAGRISFRLLTTPNKKFNDISIAENEMKMDIRATIFGDNVNNPIGKLKILLLNDNYEVIDSAMTDNFGTFKFKYLPFLKRFYLSAENTDNVLDVFKNILIYSSDANLVKIMTHQKGTKFTYNPLSAELTRLRDIELEDPWLELMPTETLASTQNTLIANDPSIGTSKGGPKLIVENILFEANDSKITPQAKEVLDKVVLVLAKNQSLKIEVGAHTDSKGSAVANLKLSEERAKIVRQYIINSGIKEDRVSSKGYGESKLLNHCDDSHECSEKEHSQNRRIEFKILDNQDTLKNENH